MQSIEQHTPAPAGNDREHQFQFFCKLFDDMIVSDLCFLRRTHFSHQNIFSCRGCSKDTILNSPHNRARRAEAGS